MSTMSTMIAIVIMAVLWAAWDYVIKPSLKEAAREMVVEADKTGEEIAPWIRNFAYKSAADVPQFLKDSAPAVAAAVQRDLEAEESCEEVSNESNPKIQNGNKEQVNLPANNVVMQTKPSSKLSSIIKIMLIVILLPVFLLTAIGLLIGLGLALG